MVRKFLSALALIVALSLSLPVYAVDEPMLLAMVKHKKYIRHIVRPLPHKEHIHKPKRPPLPSKKKHIHKPKRPVLHPLPPPPKHIHGLEKKPPPLPPPPSERPPLPPSMPSLRVPK